jgi:hypothetical protein
MRQSGCLLCGEWKESRADEPRDETPEQMDVALLDLK